MAKTYNLKEGSLHEKFIASRAKIQFFGGGFANGKTSAMVLKALQVARDYPGCNILMARSTYPKLNDTLRKTFIEFCPAEWIKSFPMSKNSENQCTLINGSTINFRYIAQRKGTEDGGSTSNLLSATYDLVCVDQIEDPEIIHKDFLDLQGRLRGSAIYRGNDPTMPRTGPRWMFISANPTRNWVYKRLIKPIHDLQREVFNEDLLCLRDPTSGRPVLGADGKPKLLIEVIEGATYTNSHNLAPDFIQQLESTYTGQMRDRYLKGEWAAYEGLVYPDFNEAVHVIRHDRLRVYLTDIIKRGVRPIWIDGYDYGLQAPSCYILAFVDQHGNVFCVDGFYQPEASVSWQASEIRRLRNLYGGYPAYTLADPAILRRGAGDGKVVGRTVADMFYDEAPEILFERGNNDIVNGITKVRSYLQSWEYNLHPIDGFRGAPRLYVSDKLQWGINEFTSYYWQTDSSGERDDKPVDRHDHFMDALKYLLSDRPNAGAIRPLSNQVPMWMTEWQEYDVPNDPVKYRH